MPFGARVCEEGVRFALWAPCAREVALELEGARETLAAQARGDGWWELRTPLAQAGTRYRYEIDGKIRVPDPASRFAPEGVHGSSEVVDPRAFSWNDEDWKRPAWETTVLYELHVGAFTKSGTYDGVVEHLDDLLELGITALEIMPLSAAPGARNWGYDGVAPFAPNCRYGRPEALKNLVMQAHARGLAVILDVVYNHFGPEGNYLHAYAAPFFTDRRHTPWGAAIDYEHCRQAREFVFHNALYWIEEYGFDGLRLDAVQEIYDNSRPDLLEELAERLAAVPGERKPFFTIETDENRVDRLAYCDAQWNDDAHHALHALVTGESDGYYIDYVERPAARLARALAEGFAYQGEPSPFRAGVLRGERSAALSPSSFVNFLQNHDQIGNRAFGERITMLAPAHRVRVAVATLLLAPAIPMLFMGEEWSASSPFLFFCDLEPARAASIREGRRNEFARFVAFADERAGEMIPDPGDSASFTRSILRWEERELPTHHAMLELYRMLLAVRAREIAPRLAGIAGAGSVVVAKEHAMSVRWTLGDGSTLSLRANFDDESCALPTTEGRTLFTTHGEEKVGDLAQPWSALWRIRDV
jgi:malto-oligosyltrehalose trehalohydrolase